MFPTPYTVVHIPVADLGEDAMGNDARVFAEPVERRAYGWRPSETEVLEGHTSRVTSRLLLALPPKTVVSQMDRFVVDGKLYEVEGERDHTKGWHSWQPGIVVKLKRVTG